MEIRECESPARGERSRCLSGISLDEAEKMKTRSKYRFSATSDKWSRINRLVIYGRVDVRCHCSLVIGLLYQITRIVSRNVSSIKRYNFAAGMIAPV